jgi:hypothetical protein
MLRTDLENLARRALDAKRAAVEELVRAIQGDGLSADGPADSERSLLVEEVKIGCTLGMQCRRPFGSAASIRRRSTLPGGHRRIRRRVRSFGR